MTEPTPTSPLPDPSILPYIIPTPDFNLAPLLPIILGTLLVSTGVGIIVLVWMRRQEVGELQEEFKKETASAVALVESTLPDPRPSLEEEIAEVSDSLRVTVTRMREVSAKAEAFEEEVRRLVRQADAARAAAALDADKAEKISMLLGERTEQRFREEITKLATAHSEQVRKLVKSGNRTAWLTFILGSFLGFLLNIVASLFVS